MAQVLGKEHRMSALNIWGIFTNYSCELRISLLFAGLSVPCGRMDVIGWIVKNMIEAEVRILILS